MSQTVTLRCYTRQRLEQECEIAVAMYDCLLAEEVMSGSVSGRPQQPCCGMQAHVEKKEVAKGSKDSKLGMLEADLAQSRQAHQVGQAAPPPIPYAVTWPQRLGAAHGCPPRHATASQVDTILGRWSDEMQLRGGGHAQPRPAPNLINSWFAATMALLLCVSPVIVFPVMTHCCHLMGAVAILCAQFALVVMANV